MVNYKVKKKLLSGQRINVDHRCIALLYILIYGQHHRPFF